MQLCPRGNTPGQFPLDIHMHIFQTRIPRKHPGLDVGRYRVKSTADITQFHRTQKTGFLKHCGVPCVRTPTA